MEEEETKKNELVNYSPIDNSVGDVYGEALIKILTSFVPIVGPIINEFIDVRSAVKQRRIENFILEFKNYLQSNNFNSDKLQDLNQEAIGDIFEEIIISVSKTSSEQKRRVFKNILYNAFAEPDIESDIFLKYVSITNRLTTNQFKILNNFNNHSANYLDVRKQVIDKTNGLNKSKTNLAKEQKNSDNGYANRLQSVRIQYYDIERELAVLNKEFKSIPNPNRSDNHELDNYDLVAEIQDLIATGLLYEYDERQSLQPIYHITKQGKKYLDYVERVENA